MFAAVDSGEWHVIKNQEDPNLTLEWLAENLWLVKRNVKPFCDDEGRRTWGGPTITAALEKACAALKVAAPIASEPQPIAGSGKQ